MSAPFHTYGPNCLLADDEPELASLYTLPTPPDIRSQFFYISSLPIDDPLAPSPPQTGQSTGNEKVPPQPFSARDNIALEKAWRDLGKARQADKRGSRPATSGGQSGIAVPGQRSSLELDRRHKNPAREDANLVSSRSTPTSVPDDPFSRNLKSRSGYLATSSDARAENYAERRHVISSLDGASNDNSPNGSGAQRKRERSDSLNDSPLSKRRNSKEEDGAEDGLEAGSLRTNRSRDASISGSPFIRAPVSQLHTPLGRSLESLSLKDGAQEEPQSTPNRFPSKPSGLRSTISLDPLAQDTSREEEDDSQAKIPVGASRLHLVELPNLKVCMLAMISRTS